MLQWWSLRDFPLNCPFPHFSSASEGGEEIDCQRISFNQQIVPIISVNWLEIWMGKSKKVEGKHQIVQIDACKGYQILYNNQCWLKLLFVLQMNLRQTWLGV